MRHLLNLNDVTKEEISQILEAAKLLRKNRHANHALKGKSVGLVFQKPSLRTRVSFEVGITQLGGHCFYLGPEEIDLGVRESTADASKTLSRYLDCIIARTHDHQTLVELTQNSSIPVVNGLSDLYHPCQGLTDLFSIQEKFGDLSGLKLAYVGDGNNVCHSLLLGCTKMGVDISVATPPGYEPNAEPIGFAMKYAEQSHSSISISNSPQDAVDGAHIIYSDVWVSMGQEEESEKRLNDFKDFQINEELLKVAKDNYIFMHCLPAHRGEEVAAEIIDGEHSIVFDQAENRLHTQKAILMFLLSNGEQQ